MHRLLRMLAIAAALAWATPVHAVSCISAGDVTHLSTCDLGPLTFSGFTVSASAGFSAGTVGLGAASTATSGKANLVFQLTTTPTIGPGDVLLSYGVTAKPGAFLTGVDLTNDAVTGPVTIGEIACRVPFSLGGTCAPADRLATLLAQPGQNVNALFANPVDFVFLHKDIMVGAGGFISDFSNSHTFGETAPTPEPATLLLLGTTLAGLGYGWRKRTG